MYYAERCVVRHSCIQYVAFQIALSGRDRQLLRRMAQRDAFVQSDYMRCYHLCMRMLHCICILGWALVCMQPRHSLDAGTHVQLHHLTTMLSSADSAQPPSHPTTHELRRPTPPSAAWQSADDNTGILQTYFKHGMQPHGSLSHASTSATHSTRLSPCIATLVTAAQR